MIKAIFLDVDDTILDFNKNAQADALLCAEQFHISLPENFMETFHRINNGLWHRIQEGTLTIPELYKLRWSAILKEFGIEVDYDAFEMAFVENLRHCAIECDYAREMVEYLYEKYPLFIASNATQIQQTMRIEKANMTKYFKAIYTSELAKAGKPKKQFFDFCLKEAGFEKDEVVMIGDSISADIIGAKEYGLTTIWYNPNGLPECPYADYTIKDLREIKNIL